MPIPETKNANQFVDLRKINDFLTGSIGAYERLDSVFAKGDYFLDLLEKLEVNPDIDEPFEIYQTDSGATQHRVFAVPNSNGVYVKQSRKRANGVDITNKPWGGTMLVRLGEKANSDYRSSIGK